MTIRFTPPARPTTGVRVSGRVRDWIPRSIYLSGTPGIYYDDGTFEFQGVPPGKHLLAGLDTPNPLGAIVVVGDSDVENVELRETATPVPFNLRSRREPDPVGAATPGSVLPLPAMRGVVLNEETKMPLTEGTLKITGYSQSKTIPIGPDGRYEIPKLFPGTYTLDVEAWAHAQMSHSVTVGTENITLDITTRRLY